MSRLSFLALLAVSLASGAHASVTDNAVDVREAFEASSHCADDVKQLTADGASFVSTITAQVVTLRPRTASTGAVTEKTYSITANIRRGLGQSAPSGLVTIVARVTQPDPRMADGGARTEYSCRYLRSR